MIRNNICLNSHPAGCAAVVKRQIDYVKSRFAGNANTPETPRLALVVGCSTGYGLASRIAASFGYGAATAGVSLEKPPSAAKTGTPGFYNNRAFDRAASFEHIPSKTLNADAFSDSAKAQAAAAVKELAEARGIPPEIDLFIYSLASPARTDPETGAVYRSVIKPIGARYTGKTLDMMSGKLFSASAEAATEEETAHTVKVMGGEDWERWIDALSAEGVLSPKVRALAYTYIGPELSWPIYKNGTIGRAKEDLERAARAIHARLAPAGGGAWVSVNKALVTRASAVIPVIPFYVSCLFKTMKEHGLHEGCAEQITRLFREKLYAPGKGGPEVDGEGRIRMDDWEMRQDIQKETGWRMAAMTEEQVFTLSDAAGFKHDFLEAHGFDAAGVDYNADTDPLGI
jgi:enoyl-[acyl-carrier protein] reductase/trans-2-enoyl-CoA reductase (NAD+)